MFTLKSAVISQDPSWENIGAAIWSCTELNVSIIASALPTLRPLFARLLPGLGLSSACNERTTYLRYGSQPAAMHVGGFKSAESRKARTQSISTEELTLQDVRSDAVVYAHASADQSKEFYTEGESGQNGIVKTMEITVNTRMR